MLHLTHISETALHVDDPNRAIQFYTELFECPKLRCDGRFCALGIRDGQVLLLFLRGHSLQPIRLNPDAIIPAHDGSGPLHVCFSIRAEDLATWERKLEERGVPVESRVNWPGCATSLYFRDSDGHAIELATPGLWKR